MSRLVLSSLVLAACTSAPPPPSVSPELLLRIASVPNLVRWHDDVLLTCERTREHAYPCDVSIVAGDGTIVPAAVGPAFAAERLSRDRLLLLRAGGRLVVREPNGDERLISEDAEDPRVASDGERVLFGEWTAESRRLVVVDTRDLARRVIAEDEHASTAFDVPGSDRVLYVSTRTGVASLYVSEADGTERQLTNLGLDTMTPEFVPVPVRQLVWLEGSRAFAFTAHYRGRDMLWRIDLATGDAIRLGRGRFPVAIDSTHLIAVDEGPSGLVVVRYPAEV